jgi:DNA polymerase
MEKYLGYIDKAIQLAKLKADVQSCTKCSELVNSRKLYPYGNATFGYGNLNSKIVFIGEAPGHLGCGRTGKPFMGDRSGDIYFKALKESGLDYEQVYTTNVVKCCPLKNRTPTLKEIEKCRTWLKKEIDIINPKVIICLGRTAANWFGIKDSITNAITKDYIVKKYNWEAIEIGIEKKISSIANSEGGSIVPQPRCKLCGEWMGYNKALRLFVCNNCRKVNKIKYMIGIKKDTKQLNRGKYIISNEGRLVKVLYHPAYPLRCGSQAVLQWLSIFKLTIKGLSEYGIK